VTQQKACGQPKRPAGDGFPCLFRSEMLCGHPTTSGRLWTSLQPQEITSPPRTIAKQSDGRAYLQAIHDLVDELLSEAQVIAAIRRVSCALLYHDIVSARTLVALIEGEDRIDGEVG
jgi:hypothetical protein